MSHRFRRFAQILDLFGLWIKSTQISQMTQIFLLEICVSLSHRFRRFAQILDLFGLWDKKHADFADDADFFVGDLCFFVPQISQIYADFFVWIFGDFSF